MKKQFIILTAIFLIAKAFLPSQSNAQTPEKMKYQAVARDNAGNVLSNQLISFRISILQTSSTGTSVYSETHQVTSNDFGLANLNIGSGIIISGNFATIDWSSDPYFLQMEMDETGGTTYQLMGTSQLLSVPYALFAKTADSLTKGMHSLSDADDNTKIQLEKNPNEDIIRFDIGGTEQWVMTGPRLESRNSGGSIFIGKDAGLADDTTGNHNIAIGQGALKNTVDRGNNIAIGDSALLNNGVGVLFEIHATRNIAIGSKSQFSNTTGNQNCSIGYEALRSNSSGYKNNAVGVNALLNNFSGIHNCAFGSSALEKNTFGSNNIAMGTSALLNSISGFQNCAFGTSALEKNISGSSNIAVGVDALANNTVGDANIAIGVSAMIFGVRSERNVAIGAAAMSDKISGNNNIAIGTYALSSDTSGHSSIAIGNRAMFKNRFISNLVALGDSSLYNNINGSANTAVGSKTMFSNTSGAFNCAFGYEALYSNSTAGFNTAIGYKALFLNLNGYSNTAIGYSALSANSSGGANVAIGRDALKNNLTAFHNTAVGRQALLNNQTGSSNTAIGRDASQSNTSGYENTSVGYQALYNTTEAGRCAAVGYQAGYNNETGFYTTAVGYKAGPTSSDIKNSTALGRGAATTATNQIRIGNSIVTSIGGYELWTNVSDKRFKKEIRKDIVGLDFIMALQPVSYQLDLEEIDRFTGYSGSPNNETDEERQFDIESRAVKEQIRKTGFIAQDVEEAAMSVGYDFSGVDTPKNEDDFYGLRYAEFVVPLVKGMQEQQEIIIQLKKEIEQQSAEKITQNANYEKLLQRIEELEKRNNQ